MFTTRQIIEQYTYTDGTHTPGTDSYITFTRNAWLTDTATGEERPPETVTAPLSATGALDVTVTTTDDPTTSPPGARYTVTEMIRGAPARSYAIAVTAGVGPLVLGLIAPLT